MADSKSGSVPENSRSSHKKIVLAQCRTVRSTWTLTTALNWDHPQGLLVRRHFPPHSFRSKAIITFYLGCFIHRVVKETQHRIAWITRSPTFTFLPCYWQQNVAEDSKNEHLFSVFAHMHHRGAYHDHSN